MKLKNILLSGLSLVLVAALAISGTVAYLQGYDDDVNVMTLGNVSIEQHEYERAVDADGNFVTYTETERSDAPTGYKLTEFTQAKPLYPATGSVTDYDDTKVYFAQLSDDSNVGYMSVLEGLNNVQDKFVFVENTGTTDAYIRTLIAIEIGDSTKAFTSIEEGSEGLLEVSVNQFWAYGDVGVVSINDNKYFVFEAVYDGTDGANGTNVKHPGGIVRPGEFTYCNLAQIYLKNEATNEDVEAIDGNDNGTLDILVLSQAVQAAGFENAQTALDTAFGKSSEKAAEWFDGTHIPNLSNSTVVSTADELADALAAGENIVLTNDVTVSEDTSINVTGDVVVDLAGNTLTMTAGDNSATAKAISVFAIKDGQTLTIEGGEFVVNFGKNGTNYSDGNVQNALFDVQAGGKLVINDGTFTATMVEDGYNLIPVIIDNNGEVEINGGSFSTNAINLFRNRNGKMTINGGNFAGVKNPLGRTDYPYTVIWNQYANSSLTVNGGTFTNIEVEKEAGSVSIANGIKLSLWVAASER